MRFCGIHLRAVIYIFDMSLKMTNLSLQPYLPGDNELTQG